MSLFFQNGLNPRSRVSCWSWEGLHTLFRSDTGHLWGFSCNLVLPIPFALPVK